MADSKLEVDCPTVKQMLDAGESFVLLDCREQDEHAFVNLPQAMLLPMSELAQRVDELHPHREQDIVVHCHHGAGACGSRCGCDSRVSARSGAWRAGSTSGRCGSTRRCRDIEEGEWRGRDG